MKIPKTFVYSGLAALTVSCAPKSSPDSKSEEDSGRPNILVFIADDAGMDFGCYGNNAIKTPNIDKMAAEGLKFENAFVTAPQCSPCRTAILSGKWAHTIGTEDLHVGIDSTTVLLPTYMQEAGYYTGLMLKHHIGEHGTDQFEYFNKESVWPDYYGTGEYDDKMMDYFRAFLDSSDTKPFFLWMGFIDPHRPFLDSKVEKNHAERVHDPADVIVPPYLNDNDSTREDLAQYYDEIHRMDKHIGWMMDELEKQGRLDNTLVIFFSDNGMPFPRAKMSLYDSGIKTPFIVWWKGKVQAGSTYNDLVTMVDLSPTIMDIVGIDIPEDWYGESIKNALFDQNVPGREYIFAERNWHGEYDYMRAIRTKEFKLIKYGLPEYGMQCDDQSLTGREMKRLYDAGELEEDEMRCYQKPDPDIELFNLDADPFELNNIADNEELNEIKGELLKEIEKWQEETRDHEPDVNKVGKSRKEIEALANQH
jgi:N-sulfoglucosamine sulfohydrolase